MEFRILGPLEVWHDEASVRIPGVKERALLVLLLLHANEPVPVDRLIDELWGGRPPPTARKSIQVRIAALRRGLGADTVQTRGDGYAIVVGHDELDLHRFERLVSEAREQLAAGEPGTATQTLAEGLALWRGSPLADFAYESFAQPAIARLEELRLAAVELRNDAELAAGRHGHLVGELEELVASHPLRERLAGQLMLALYRDERQAEALAVYTRLRDHLVTDLGLEPSPALQNLQQAILRQEPDLDPGSPERSVLLAPLEQDRWEPLIALAESLARRPRREVILARLIPPTGDLGPAAADTNHHRQTLLDRGVVARAVAFTSSSPGDDLVRIALEQDVDLLLVDAAPPLVETPVLETVLARAPCDVGVLVPREQSTGAGPVLVLFGGSEHDWAAVELGAWIARAQDVSLRLGGPSHGRERDASRTLGSASLAVQRVLGIATEPVLVGTREADVLAQADDARLVLAGLPARWRTDGLGPTRSALAASATAPVLLVRRGLRPGGLAPRESLTRFTWTLGPTH